MTEITHELEIHVLKTLLFICKQMIKQKNSIELDEYVSNIQKFIKKIGIHIFSMCYILIEPIYTLVPEKYHTF
jgi:hypothetical protein